MKKLFISILALSLSAFTEQNQTEEIMFIQKFEPGKNIVEFSSEGITLKGDLYLPSGYQEGKKYPAIIVGGSWTTVKEQMAGLYAGALAEEGYVTLAFDHTYYGESGGDKRFYEDPKTKTKDFINAMNFLKALPMVAEDRTGGMGICASGGYMAEAVAQDSDYKSFTTVVPWFNTDEVVNAFYGGEEGINERIAKSRAAEASYEQNGVMEYQLTISDTDPSAAMYGPFEYYLDPAIGQVKNWSHDKFAVMNWENWLTYRPLPAADKISVPTLIINSKNAATPAASEAFFNHLKGEKEMVWLEGGQLDFYYKEAQVKPALSKIVEHFKKTL